MSLKIIYPYIQKHKYKIIAGIIIVLIVDFFQLLIPYAVKQAIDIITYNIDDYSKVYKYGIFIMAAGILMTFLRYWWRIFLLGTSRYLEKGVRSDLFRHVLLLDSAFFDRTRTGDIMTHATSDITHIRMAVGVGLVAFVDSVLLGSVTIGIMLYINFKLALLSFIPMPMIVIMAKILGKKMHDFHNDAQASFSKLTESIRESFVGIKVIKIFNFEKYIQSRVFIFCDEYFGKSLKRAYVNAVIKPLMVFFLNLSLFIIIFYGGYLVMENKFTAGDLVAFTQYLSLLAWPMIALGWMVNLIERGLASLQRINGIIETQPYVKDDKDSVGIDSVEKLDFINTSFSYDNKKNCIENINFSCKKGDFIGITGPPGSGKSSLVSLFPRFYKINEGSICINSKDIEKIKLESLRSKISFMPQESFLFSGTIKENILLGREYNEKNFNSIIEDCGLKSTISEMPQGIDTKVGERGLSLSGGQKQRVALARTLYQEKDIIILDDPVSQIDTDTANFIIKGIKKRALGKMLIIVSHRISVISEADNILVLKNGNIDACGDHHRLMEENNFYREMYKIQKFEKLDES
ncbi:MAG: multidrug ABC transporter ATP-binding protein [Deltaproteobacteria bacterium]|nr:MAG: multidrug ABC transporter ATP-binding protein [Deltaproteobacteria bacterium]